MKEKEDIRKTILDVSLKINQHSSPLLLVQKFVSTVLFNDGENALTPCLLYVVKLTFDRYKIHNLVGMYHDSKSVAPTTNSLLQLDKICDVSNTYIHLFHSPCHIEK